MASVRVLCLWCPDWPVVASRPAAGMPVAMIERGVVVAASREARAEGVRRGLRRREAEARCPGLVTLPRDPSGEGRAFETVARATEALAPRLAVDRPGLLFVPTRGPSRYFGGDAALGERLVAEVAATGAPDVRIGVADGAFAARLAARRAGSGAVVVVDPGATPDFLAPWPVGVLEDGELSGLLIRLGLTTLGQFAALPAASILGRFGPDGLAAHRRARGLDEHPLAVSGPPPERVETHEFDPPAERVETAVFAGRGLAERLTAALAADGLSCVRVRIEAETEHGERRARSWRLDPAAGGPSLLADRVRSQLDAWDTTAGLSWLRLVPEEVVVAGRSQLGLWGGDRAAAERAARALVRVQGQLGPEAVVTPVLSGGRSPDERIRWVAFGEERDGGPEPAPWPGVIPGPAPAVVFSHPPAARLLDAEGRPVTVSGRGEASAAPRWLRSAALPGGGGPVDGWAGPWLYDLRWWDPTARRRRARWQVVAAGVACLVATEGAAAHLEAVYD